MSLKIIHFAKSQPQPRIWTDAFLDRIQNCGDFTLHTDTGSWPRDRLIATAQSADVILTGWGSCNMPTELAADPGKLRYICHLTGTMRDCIPIEIIRSPIMVTNWGDAPAFSIAEGTLTLLLACLKNLPDHILSKRKGQWNDGDWQSSMSSVRNLRLGVYGFGAIARKFVELCSPLQPVIHIFDPYATDLPAGSHRADSLAQLMQTCHAIAVMAPLNAETENSITAQLLAMLPDHAVIVNTARGAIIDEAALTAELVSGRLRAALDVLAWGESPLPDNHPLRTCNNVILSGHIIGRSPWPHCPGNLSDLHLNALDNLKRFQQQLPLRFIMDEHRYLQST